jgi:molecular chaperone HtpG
MEINPEHPLIEQMALRAKESGASEKLKDAVWLLFDQARLLDGDTLSDANAFSERLNALLTKAIGK